MLTTSPILRPRLAQKLIQTTTTTTSFRKMATTTTTNTDGTPRKLRILMLHGAPVEDTDDDEDDNDDADQREG